MRRTATIAALLFAFAAPALAAPTHTAPYLDAKGKCHAANGNYATMTVCKPPAPASRAPHCTTGKPCGNTCIAQTATCHAH